MDTCYNSCEPGKGWFSSDERKWINKIYKLKEQYPDLVDIRNEPETNDGCINCVVPSAWFKLQPPRKSNMTEEERAAVGERLKAYRKTM